MTNNDNNRPEDSAILQELNTILLAINGGESNGSSPPTTSSSHHTVEREYPTVEVASANKSRLPISIETIVSMIAVGASILWNYATLNNEVRLIDQQLKDNREKMVTTGKDSMEFRISTSEKLHLLDNGLLRLDGKLATDISNLRHLEETVGDLKEANKTRGKN